MRIAGVVILTVSALLLGGCNTIRNDLDKGMDYGNGKEILTRKTDARRAGKKSEINAYVWRAALGTVRSYPLLVSDAERGVIVTDWYSPPQNPNERQKISIDVMGGAVRRDMVRVQVERQNRDNIQAGWVQAPVTAIIAQSLENDILFTARDLRGW